MNLSEPQKRVLRTMYDWGHLARVHTDLGSITPDGLSVLHSLDECGLLKCLWAPWRIIFSLTPEGCEAAKELLGAQRLRDGEDE